MPGGTEAGKEGHTEGGLVVRRLRESDDGWTMTSDNTAYRPRPVGKQRPIGWSSCLVGAECPRLQHMAGRIGDGQRDPPYRAALYAAGSGDGNQRRFRANLWWSTVRQRQENARRSSIRQAAMRAWMRIRSRSTRRPVITANRCSMPGLAWCPTMRGDGRMHPRPMKAVVVGGEGEKQRKDASRYDTDQG